jgi:hypothetical protein
MTPFSVCSNVTSVLTDTCTIARILHQRRRCRRIGARASLVLLD